MVILIMDMIIREMTVAQIFIPLSVIITGFLNCMQPLASRRFENWMVFFRYKKKIINTTEAYCRRFPEIKFRNIPDPAGDSCTFLSWFLPNREITEAVVDELKAQQYFCRQFLLV